MMWRIQYNIYWILQNKVNIKSKFMSHFVITFNSCLISDSLSYIGHSMGTTEMFALLWLEPQFEEYINPYIALSAVALLNHMPEIFQISPFITDPEYEHY